MRQFRSPIVSHVRQTVFRLLSAFATIAMLVGLLGGGRRYLFCTSMNAALPECCCDHEDDSARSPGSTIRPSCCCESHSVSALPKTSSGTSALAVAAAPFVQTDDANAPGLFAILPWISTSAPTFAEAPKTGPPRRSEVRAKLMVYQI